VGLMQRRERRKTFQTRNDRRVEFSTGPIIIRTGRATTRWPDGERTQLKFSVPEPAPCEHQCRGNVRNALDRIG